MRWNISPLVAASLITSLISTSGFAAENSGKDLVISDLQKLGLSAVHKGADLADNPDTTAALTGLIFQECADQLRVKAIAGDAKGRIGFTVTDMGGMQCQIKNKSNKLTCSDRPCVSFSSLPGAKMSLSAAPSGELVLISHREGDGDEMSDGITEVEALSLLNDKILPHVSKKQLAEQARETARQLRAAEIRFYESNLRACRTDEEQLLLAREAAQALFDLDPRGHDLERMLRELDEAEFKILSKKARKASLDDVDEVREALMDWAASHEGSETAVARELELLASKVVDDKDGTREVKLGDYRMAKEILSEASNIDGISSSMRSQLKNDIQANQLGFVSAVGMGGDMFTFNRLMSEQMAAAQKQIYRACYTKSRDMEGCSAAQNTYRNMAAIPVQVQKIQQQRQLEQQKMDAELAKLMGNPQQTANNPGAMPNNGQWMQNGGWNANSFNSGNGFNSGNTWIGGSTGRPNVF